MKKIICWIVGLLLHVYLGHIGITYANDAFCLLIIIDCFIISVIMSKRVRGKWKSFLTAGLIGTVIIFASFELCILSECKSDIIEDVNVDYIVVLGGRLQNDEPTRMLLNRMDEAIELCDRLCIPIIVTGGRQKGKNVAEADVMLSYILERGNPPDVIVEEKAQNTKENFQNIKEIVGDKKIVIVTSDFHMFRAKLLAKSVGFSEIYGVVSEPEYKYILYYNLREVVAIAREFFLDWCEK